jgi:hypothetical protein
VPSVESDYRFLVDEASFWVGDADAPRIELALDSLSDQLELCRERAESVGIATGYEWIECRRDEQLFEVLASADLDRDCRVRAFRLLDKCGRFDASADFYVDPQVRVDGHDLQSYAIAAALQAGRARHAIGVFAMLPVYRSGVVVASDESGEAKIVAITSPYSRVLFYRELYSVEQVDEDAFFDMARLAFPAIRFADGVTFRRLDGSYDALRATVVYHLCCINDSFKKAYSEHCGRSDEVSSAMGIDISIESSKTRQSERLMRERDAIYDGKVYRCEWHSKLEPHRNRIHLHPGDAASDDCVVIGMFVDHLST